MTATPYIPGVNDSDGPFQKVVSVLTVNGNDVSPTNPLPVDTEATSLGTAFTTFSQAIGTAITQVSASSIPVVQGMIIKAALDNDGKVYIGGTAVTADSNAATDGFELSASESLTVPLSDVNLTYGVSGTASQKIFVIGV